MVDLLVEAGEQRNKGIFLSSLRLLHCDQDKLRKSQVLHIACRNGWLDVVKKLITNSDYHMNPSVVSSSTVRHHGGDASPFHLACTSGNLELVQYLIHECDCDIYECTSDGLSTMHCSIMGGLHIVKYLVEHSTLHTITWSHDFPQMILFAYYNWDNNLMKYLIVECKCSIIINKSTGDTVLHYACRDGYIARLRFLIEECKCDSRVLNKSGHTLLYTVCSSYADLQKPLCKDMLMYLIELNSFDIKHELKRSKVGLNTVECAIMVRWEVAVKRLVALCDDQDDKYRIISLAYYHWDDPIMRYLIPELGIVTNGITRNTLLHNACRDMSLDKIKFIADMSDIIDFDDIVDMNKNTLLHAFSGSSVRVPSSTILSYIKLKCKYSTNAFKYTPLEWAIVHQTMPMLAVASVRCLVKEYGSDELHGGRILALAFQHWSDDMIKYLLVEMKCSPVTDVSNGDDTTILHMACRTGNIEQVKFLIETCHCNPHDVKGSSYNESLIHAAINYFDIIQYLCIEWDYYTDLSGHQNTGTTAMKSAIAQGERGLPAVKHLVEKCKVEGNCKIMSFVHKKWCTAIVKYLIVDAKFDVYIDTINNTILHLSANQQDLDQSAMNQNLKRLKFLIDICHCSPHIKNDNGESLIHVTCRYRTHISIFDILHYLCIDCNCCPDLTGSSQEVGIIAMKSAIALSQKKEGLPVVKHLVEKCKVESSCEIMSAVFDHWCPTIVKYLIVDAKFALYCDTINTIYTLFNNRRSTILHLAATQKDLERLQFLIDICHCSPRIKNDNGESLIHAACQHNDWIDFDVLCYLCIDCNCCPDLTGASQEVGIIAMKLAITQKEKGLAVVKHLVEKCKVESSCEIMSFACNNWYEDVLKYLIVDAKFDLTTDMHTGFTVLHNCVCIIGNFERLKFLMETCHCTSHIETLVPALIRQIDVIFQSSNPLEYFHMLHYLLVKFDGHHTIVVRYHDVAKTVECCYNNNQIKNCTEIIYLLIRNCLSQSTINATTDDDICSSILRIAYNMWPYKNALQCLLLDKKCKMIIDSSTGNTVLHYACSEMNLSMLKFLLEDCKCDIQVSNNKGETILHTLCRIYSTEFLSLIDYLLYDCQLDITSVNKQGDTVLHVACRNFKGDIALIERVISNGKVNMLTKNNLDETPLMLLDNCCRKLGDDATKQVKQLIARFGEVQLTHQLHSYVNVVLVGNPGVGKSTLAKVIKDRHNYLITPSLRNVKGVELYTAGIIPNVLNDKDIGRVILHDLAGQVEYYSSHTAVLENLLQGSAAVFVAVVSLADANCIKFLYQWFNIIENVSHNALHQCQLIVVTSHIDQSVESDLNQLKQSISDLCSQSNKVSKSVLKYHGVFELDCRKLGGNYLASFISSLSKACKSITDNDTREMSLYCHMLYDFFQRDGKISYTLASLIELSENNNGLFLPKDIKNVESIVSQLSSTGLVVYLQSRIQLSKSWVVADKSVLLSELNGILFAPQDFKQHVQDIASNTGVVKLSHLYSKFPNYDPELLLQFLQYMKLCSVISGEFLTGSNMQPPLKDSDDQYIFVPALIKSTERPEISQTVFKFGWCLRCTKHSTFFISRFIHLVQLHLACKFSIKNSITPSKFERLCKIWTKGIRWKDTKGVEALVEVANSNQALIVLMSCEDGCESDMFNLIHDVLAEILSCKQQVMPRVVSHDFIIDNSFSLQRSLDSLDNVLLYSVQLLANQCFLKRDLFVLDSTGENRIPISKLVAHGDTTMAFDAIFAGRDPNWLANAENMWVEDNTHCQSFAIQDSSDEFEIIKVPPTSKKFFRLLLTKSMHWDDIGRELGICLNDCKHLQSSVTQFRNLSDNHCLESILDQWVESSNPDMLWDQFKAAMNRLQYNDVLEMMERSGTEAHETDHITSTENDSPIKVVDLQAQHITSTNSEGTTSIEPLASSDLMKSTEHNPPINVVGLQADEHTTSTSLAEDTTLKEPLVSPDVIVESSTLSPFQILKSHTPQLLGLISDPYKLAIDLWSADLLSDATKDEVETNTSLNRYKKANCVLSEITRLISSMDLAQQMETFEKFCNVLKSQGDPGLERISSQMIAAMKTNSTPNTSPDVIIEPSTLSPIQLLKSHTPQLLDVDHQLTNDLQSANLLSDAAKYEVETNTNTSLNQGIRLVDVLNNVISVTDWSSLGLALGLEYHEIERIRRDGCDEKDRLTRTVSMWFKFGANISWEHLVEALRSELVKEITLASTIEQKYL